MSWRQWKAAVDIETVLERAGLLEGLRREGDRLVGPCPVHGGDNPRAFRVDCQRSLWYCFTHCGKGGDQLSLAWHLCGRSWPQTARWLQGSTDSRRPGEVSRLRSPAQPIPIPTASRRFVPFTRQLPLTTGHPFFDERGLCSRTLENFEAGMWHGRGFLEGMAAVRLFDTHGRPLGYAGRRLDPEAVRHLGKWKWPTGFPKSSMLYNWHRAWPQASDGLILVEGVWSVMKLAQAGYVNAVALGGTAVSNAQAARLRQASRLILMLDGDAAGWQAAQRCQTQQLHPQLVTLRLPPEKDPADLSEEALRWLLAPLFPSR